MIRFSQLEKLLPKESPGVHTVCGDPAGGQSLILLPFHAGIPVHAAGVPQGKAPFWGLGKVVEEEKSEEPG